MSKICLIALFVFFTVTAITARSTDAKRIARSSNNCSVASKVGDSCTSSLDCRCGNSEMECLFSKKTSTLECQVNVPDSEYTSDASDEIIFYSKYNKQKKKKNTETMSKICLIALFVLLTVTAITARSTDPKRIPRSSNDCSVASKAGDPCRSRLDCRCGNSEMDCVWINKVTFECQVYVPDPKKDPHAMNAEWDKKQQIEFEKSINELKSINFTELFIKENNLVSGYNLTINN
ncbi:hypothetical protein HCN44_010739 [Aphidius gifuensis]|uniref:Venom protein n=1 Tax=Aphidius gifuensis TaxID=684658 RepID=A0A835CS59_APHGI|nr:hypothetical protein HCN44_010739 [Aphidius gifuensis]